MANHPFNGSQPAILVVEDDVIVAEDLRGLLTAFGYHVPSIALNATEALAAVAQHPVDLALLDISLSGQQDGVALAHLLRGQEIPFVFVTAHSDAKTLEAAKQTRPYGYLVKPFSRHDIQPVVEIALYQHRNERLEKRVAAEQYEKEQALTQLRLRRLEGEQALLLQISNAIATIRDKSSLLHFIETRLTPIFRHLASGVFIVDTSQNYHYDLMVEYDRKEVNATIKRDVGNHIRHGGTAVEYLMQQPGPGIYDLEALEQQGYGHPHFPIMFAAGIKACLAAGMKAGGESVGLFCLCAADTTDFSPAQLPLFAAIAEQVAAAVSNILANEEILEREQEKALLLSLSADMAALRNREELYRVIMKKLRPLIGFDDAVVIHCTDDQQYCHSFLTMATPERKAHPDYRQVVTRFLPVKDTYFEHFLAQGDIYVWNVAEMMTRYGHADIGLRLMQETGLHHTVNMKLRQGGQLLGLFQFHFARPEGIQPKNFPLYKSIADQFAVAFSNILATEEILEREQEKALLLSLSADMAALRNREELYRVIMKKLRPLIGFDDAVVTRCTDDYQYFNHFLTMSLPERRAHPAYKQVVSQFFPVKGTYFEHFLAQEDFYVWNLAEMMTRYNHMGLRLMQETGLHHTVNMKLRQGGQLLGLFQFHFARPEGIQPKNFSLYKSIADQLAVAFSNILATEALVEQRELREMQLAVNNAVITLPDQESMFSSVAGAMNQVIPIDMLGVLQIDPGSKQIHLQSFLKKNNAFAAVPRHNDPLPAALTKPGTDSEAAALTGMFTQAAVLTGEAYLAHCAGNPIAQFACQTWGIRSAIYLPIPVHGPACQALLLGSKSPYAFVEKDLRMIQEVCPQIALATDRRRAFERISALKAQVAQENVYLQEEIKHSHNFTEMVGESAALGKVLAQIQQVAPTDATVLIEGNGNGQGTRSPGGAQCFAPAGQNTGEAQLCGPARPAH